MCDLKLNVEKLVVGNSYKLPRLLDLLEVEYTNDTRGRKRRLGDIKQFLIIEDMDKKIYRYLGFKEKIIKKEDNRGKSEGSKGNNNGKYAKYTEQTLINYLISGKTHIYTTYNYLGTLLGFINENYSSAKSEKSKFFKHLMFKQGLSNNQAMYDIFHSVETSFKGSIDTSLKKLVKNNCIEYVKCFIICDGKDTRVADCVEEATIKDVEEELMIEFGIESKSELFRDDKKSKKFYEMLNEKITKEELIDNYEYHYSGFDITVFKDKIKKFVKCYDVTLKQNLNIEYINAMIEKCKKEKETSYDLIHDCTWGINAMNNTLINQKRTSHDYLESVDIVIKAILDIKTAKFEIKDKKKLEEEVTVLQSKDGYELNAREFDEISKLFA